MQWNNMQDVIETAESMLKVTENVHGNIEKYLDTNIGNLSRDDFSQVLEDRSLASEMIMDAKHLIILLEQANALTDKVKANSRTILHGYFGEDYSTQASS